MRRMALAVGRDRGVHGQPGTALQGGAGAEDRLQAASTARSDSRVGWWCAGSAATPGPLSQRPRWRHASRGRPAETTVATITLQRRLVGEGARTRCPAGRLLPRRTARPRHPRWAVAVPCAGADLAQVLQPPTIRRSRLAAPRRFAYPAGSPTFGMGPLPVCLTAAQTTPTGDSVPSRQQPGGSQQCTTVGRW